jgi:hypothetical protein
MAWHRWKFLDPARPDEATRRDRVLAAVDRFWAAFTAKQDAIGKSGCADVELFTWMADLLHPIDPRLAWEIGPLEQGGRCLTISPESQPHLGPLVSAILDRAPDLPDWTFMSHRPPVPASLVASAVQGRAGAGLTGWTVTSSTGQHHRIDLTYFAPSRAQLTDERSLEIAFVATECLLGEAILDEWIGGIRVLPSGWRRRGSSLADLQGEVAAAIDRIRARLPHEPQRSLAADLSVWKLFELDPEPAPDYPAQRDLQVAKSPLPDMWFAAHSTDQFSSRRFSRCGETFCYVKVDSSGATSDERFAQKATLEDALMEALDQTGAGAFVGGGLGMKYSYIDLALTDLDRGLDVARRALAEVPAPPRAWIQFFDADLAAEWIGILPDSPPPPMPDSD